MQQHQLFIFLLSVIIMLLRGVISLSLILSYNTPRTTWNVTDKKESWCRNHLLIWAINCLMSPWNVWQLAQINEIPVAVASFLMDSSPHILLDLLYFIYNFGGRIHKNECIRTSYSSQSWTPCPQVGRI